MKQMIATGLAALLLACLLGGCGRKEALSTEIVVDGVHFTVVEVNENPMFAPGGMEEGYAAFDVALKYTRDEGADLDAAMQKLNSGVRFVAPDGTEYEKGASYATADTNVHLLTGVPAGTDISKLVMRYEDQRVALA